MAATLRLKLAASKTYDYLRTGRPVSMGRILREAGYSESVARNPDIVTKSKGWREVMDILFPNQELANVHREILFAKKTYYRKDGKKVTVADHDIRLKALDMAYKIKGLYHPKQVIRVVRPFAEFDDISDEELETIDGVN